MRTIPPNVLKKYPLHFGTTNENYQKLPQKKKKKKTVTHEKPAVSEKKKEWYGLGRRHLSGWLLVEKKVIKRLSLLFSFQE